MEINELEQIALAGDVDLQYKLGMMYEEENDVKKALGYFIKSANLGNEHAMQQVADMYSGGIGTEKNEAASYLHMAYELDGETIFED